MSSQLLEHPEYNSDLAPFVYHLLVSLKYSLRGDGGRRAGNGAQMAARTAKTSYRIRKFVDSWKKCLENKGDCVEN